MNAAGEDNSGRNTLLGYRWTRPIGNGLDFELRSGSARHRAHKNTLKSADGDPYLGNSTAIDPTRRGLFAHGLGM